MTMNKVRLGGLLADPALAKVMREAGVDKAKKIWLHQRPFHFATIERKLAAVN